MKYVQFHDFSSIFLNLQTISVLVLFLHINFKKKMIENVFFVPTCTRQLAHSLCNMAKMQLAYAQYVIFQQRMANVV